MTAVATTPTTTVQDLAAPAFAAGEPIASGGGDGDDHVTRWTVVTWYLVAGVLGSIVATIAWARTNGLLSTGALLARVRGRS